MNKIGTHFQKTKFLVYLIKYLVFKSLEPQITIISFGLIQLFFSSVFVKKLIINNQLLPLLLKVYYMTYA